MKGRLFFAGLNPASLRSMISGPRRRGDSRNAPVSEPEEKDYYAPVLIESTHLAGEISKVNVGTTHMAVLTTLGLIYTWGMGKSGQLIRPDDDSKSLELVDTDDKVLVASDVVCAGDCSWLVEKESGKVYGCGFNSSGQLGKMETQQDQSVMTFKTKKRVVKVRQPANIYFRPREIAGMPRRSSIVEIENGGMGQAQLSPPSDSVNQNLLEWALTVFQRNYRPRYVVSLCLKYGNNEAAALVETLANDHEAALQHRLADTKNQNKAAVIADYVEKKNGGGNCFEQAYRFVAIVIQHWKENSLQNANLETILESYRKISPWDAYISRVVKEMLSVADDRAKWIAASFTPSFILNCIRDSKRSVVGDYTGTINAINETAVDQSGDSDFTEYKPNGISSRLSIEEREIGSQ